MRIVRASDMGMCFGVRDALRTARQLAEPTDVTINGELVHNRQVLDELAARGFRQLAEDDRERPPSTGSILITAHGISDRERTRLKASGSKLIDTTCPLVHHVHESARKLEREGRFVLVVGKPGHVEVRGIVGDLQSFEVVADVEAVRTYPAAQLGVVCQSTVPPRHYQRVLVAIETHNQGKSIRTINTICGPTRNRQQAVLELVAQVDSLVVVGGHQSNNTRELHSLALAHGVPAHHVETALELRPGWFLNCHTVGLTAGTSTLAETVDAVYERLLGIAAGAELTARKAV